VVLDSVRIGTTCAGSGKGWRACVERSLNRVRVIRRAAVWLVVQGVGTLMVVGSVAVGRAQ
jgi:hypothetical protein